MEKRVTFRGWLLPLLLIAPQVVISLVFFFYPAGQAVWQSLFVADPFGLPTSNFYLATGFIERPL
jgi:sn-glycerol 3-phosphate transport system permease protein